MKAIQQAGTAQKLMGEVRLARLRLAKAESELTVAKKQAHLARQRRKEAKQSARRAKKRARQVKEKVAGAKLAVAALKTRLARLARTDSTQVKRKSRRLQANKVAVAPRRKSLAAAVDAQPRESLKIKKPVARRTASQRKPRPTGKAAKRRIARIRDLEAPVVLIPPEASKATGQIVEEVGKIFTGEIQEETPAEQAFSESLSPPEANPVTPDQTSSALTINLQETP
ncbi:MAG: hypothetical protein PHY43_13700 [Verrucomicrobiales bacterium]|nr:hypothetical protein [Verrucomicrobiales bacterium]